MKRSITRKMISFLLVLVLGLTTPVAVVAHAAEDSKGKYVSEVFIAYGKDEAEAKKWLTDNNWEPVGKDLNAGNASKYDDDVAAVMGIKRTNDPDEAVTDMATMNMKGAYSFDDYESLVEEKKANINEFIRTFIPVLEEYRANFNGEGGEAGKKRAQYAHDLLNKFVDGDPADEYARNDTGLPLGDLFLNKTRTEYSDDDYSKLSDVDKKKTADFTQIILESTAPAVIAVEQALAMATDTADTTWLERLPDYADDGLLDHLTELVPEAKGKRITESIAMNYIRASFGDTAEALAEDWYDINEELIWFEEYCEGNGLAQEEGESDEDYGTRVENFFNALKEEDENAYNEEYTRFTSVGTYYYALSEVAFEGDWGDTLFDFFRDEDEEEYGADADNFLSLAAALSNGQRAGIELVPLASLLQLGLANSDVIEAQFPKLDEVFNGEHKDSISIYSGMNRAIFRQGVALTSEALMKKTNGEDPYENLWGEGGVIDIVSYVSLGVGVISLAMGATMAVRVSRFLKPLVENEAALVEKVAQLEASIARSEDKVANAVPWKLEAARQQLYRAERNCRKALEKLDEVKEQVSYGTKYGTAARWMMGVGGVLVLAAAALKAAQLAKFYNRDFTQIPRMIVNEDDIVSYSIDKNGNVVKDINFNQFVYYEVVKCNRQQIGINEEAQSGVDKYQEWGCGDAADLGCDIGLQWLALYVNKSREKGDPILADSIVVQYGSKTAPESNMGTLHMFNFTNSVDVGSEAYNLRNDKEGIYMFWKTDENAFTFAASTFNYGYLALAAIGGLAAGIVGTTIVVLPKRKKNKADATA